MNERTRAAEAHTEATDWGSWGRELGRNWAELGPDLAMGLDVFDLCRIWRLNCAREPEEVCAAEGEKIRQRLATLC